MSIMNKIDSSRKPHPSHVERRGGPTPPTGGLQGAEIWKVLPGFPRYEVSNMGRVRSNCCKNGKKVRYVMKTFLRTNGYLYVSLYFPDPETGRVKVKHMDIHRLVARAFIGKCKKGRVVDHISGDRLDNRLENLRYITKSENIRSKHTERFKNGFRIEVFRDGVFIEEVTSRKRLLQVVGRNVKFKNSKGGLSLNALFCNGRTWRYKNFYAVLILPHDEVEPGPAPHVQFRLDI